MKKEHFEKAKKLQDEIIKLDAHRMKVLHAKGNSTTSFTVSCKVGRYQTPLEFYMHNSEIIIEALEKELASTKVKLEELQKEFEKL
jgi:hypothetical protein